MYENRLTIAECLEGLGTSGAWGAERGIEWKRLGLASAKVVNPEHTGPRTRIALDFMTGKILHVELITED